MTPDGLLVLAVLGGAMVLFLTERLRPDLVALLVLSALALSGIVTPAEALSGFASPAVVTVWAVFVLSGALGRTGVAALIGQRVLGLAGSGEPRLMAVIMLSAAGLSAFMNNVGVAAMLLPVVMDIARRTRRPPSRLLMPLAYGSLLGGTTTLIGTPPNLLVNEAAVDAGLPAFGMFDFARLGLPVTLVGIAFTVLVGRRLLPERDAGRALIAGAGADADGNAEADGPGEAYRLAERLAWLRVPAGSTLVGRRLADSRLGTALGLSVLAVSRGERLLRAPEPDRHLTAGDRLLVVGRIDRLALLRGWRALRATASAPSLDVLLDEHLAFAELRLADGALDGSTLRRADVRRRYGLNVLAVVDAAGRVQRTDLQDLPLRAGGVLLVLGPQAALAAAEGADGIAAVERLSAAAVDARYALSERLMSLTVPAGSTLDGISLAESELGGAFDLVVLAVRRGDRTLHVPAPDVRLASGDVLIVEGKAADRRAVRGLQSLELLPDPPPALEALASEAIGLAEVVLSPHTRLAGRTLRELRFRDRYGLNVLGVLSGGTAYRSGLADRPLRHGDALLVYGPRERITLLGAEPDWIVLSPAAQPPPRRERTLVSALIMLAVLLPVILGWLPIAIAAVAGAAAMVLTGCLTMDEAYEEIEWKAVFLIAGLLPLGIAVERTGLAALVADGVVRGLAPIGWWAVAGGLFVVSNLATQVMPNPAVAVLMAPIALRAADGLGLPPAGPMMVVAVAASAAVMSPVGHPANLLVMGPGGYELRDYLRLGLPLTLLMLLVTVLVLPLVWPLG